MIAIHQSLRLLLGELRYEVWRGRNGAETCIDRCAGPNLVVASGEAAIVDALQGLGACAITKFGVGSSAIAPAPGDVALIDAVLVGVTAITRVSPTSIAIDWNLARGVATDLAISEFGLLTAADTLVARKTRATPILKGADVRIFGTWTLHF